MGESFRILSPYNPNEFISRYHMQRVCRYVVESFHVLFVDEESRNHSLTVIEKDLYEKMTHLREKWI